MAAIPCLPRTGRTRWRDDHGWMGNAHRLPLMRIRARGMVLRKGARRTAARRPVMFLLGSGLRPAVVGSGPEFVASGSGLAMHAPQVDVPAAAHLLIITWLPLATALLLTTSLLPSSRVMHTAPMPRRRRRFQIRQAACRPHPWRSLPAGSTRACPSATSARHRPMPAPPSREASPPAAVPPHASSRAWAGGWPAAPSDVKSL